MLFHNLRKLLDLTTSPTRVGAGIEPLIFAYIDLGDFKSAAETLDRMKEIESDHRGLTNPDIQLHLARGDFSVAQKSSIVWYRMG